MKTDYAALGRESLQALRHTTAEAGRVQRLQLAEILRRNAGTEYGVRYGFSAINSVAAFQKSVPLSRYSDYEFYIRRLLAGEEQLLTREAPVYYAITSGSTGTPKYVPVTTTDMQIHYRYIYGGIFGMVQEYYPHVRPEALFGRILETGEFARTCLADGTMCGIRSASLFQWMDRSGNFDASDYCVPKEVLFPELVEDLTYLKARFALADPGITAIHSVFLHRVVGMLDYILENWELLLHDMEQGTVDDRVPLADSWKEKLGRWLPPNPQRAAELRALKIPACPEAMLTRIWPRIRYLTGIGGANFPVYSHAMKRYGAGVPIHHYIYGASEGFLSIGAGVDVPDAYILLPEAGFFEFLPVDGQQETSCAKALWEVEAGQRYELAFTNHSGLYRYRMQDVLEVVGFYGEAPVVRFCYRLNQALNVADEKLNTEQLEEALRLFARYGLGDGASFCVQEDFSVRPGRYLIYVEASPLEDADRRMDDCLCRASFGYRGCRGTGDIGPVRVRFLPHGSFRLYEQLLAGQGRTLTQYKPIRILKDEQSRCFFAAQADKFSARGCV